MNLLPKILFVLMLLLPQAGPKVVPVDQEPRHKIVFENQFVRVIDAALPPGDTTLFHTHSRDNVPVAITSGRMRVQNLGAEASESPVEAGQVWFAKASYTHQIRNLSETALRFIDAEIVSSAGNALDAPKLEETSHIKLEMENDQVRIYRVELAAGESTGMHSHSLPRLSVAIKAAKIQTASAQGRIEALQLEPANFSWHSPGPHSVENIGRGSYQAIEIEWK